MVKDRMIHIVKMSVRLKLIYRFNESQWKFQQVTFWISKNDPGVPVMVQQKLIWLGTMRLWVRSLALLSGLRSSVAMSCGVGHICGSDPILLWLWSRPAAVAPIRPLAWEPPYAVGVALKSQKKKKNLNFICRGKRTRTANTIMKKNKVGGLMLSNFKTKATTIKTIQYWSSHRGSVVNESN